MPPQLAPDKVTFDDGTPSTIDQQAKDVADIRWQPSSPRKSGPAGEGLAPIGANAAKLASENPENASKSPQKGQNQGKIKFSLR